MEFINQVKVRKLKLNSFNEISKPQRPIILVLYNDLNYKTRKFKKGIFEKS